jgi:hypothetical protein
MTTAATAPVDAATALPTQLGGLVTSFTTTTPSSPVFLEISASRYAFLCITSAISVQTIHSYAHKHIQHMLNYKQRELHKDMAPW